MKKLMILSGALAAFAVCADEVPEVSNITMTQGSGSRLVTITYNLANAAAVVTLDIQTNAAENVWSSIGGENIQNVSGDVWKRIEVGARTITWRPDLSWPDHKITEGGARAVVTAWSVDNPPDYMVVNLAANATKNSETYYPAVEFLPGGLLSNSIYRTSQLVMRKIAAQGVTWEMGSRYNESSRSDNETMHTVTLDDNYYIAVFQMTQSQWALIQTKNPKPSSRAGDMRPVEQVCYNEIRNAANTQTANTSHDYPADPNPDSFLGLLRTKTGLAFDLPSEAQWEFACRAGHGSGYLGDGSTISTVNITRLGRCMTNGGTENATANVGSYASNSWGLYDMHGNLWEWCLDWYAADITKLEGAVNATAGSSRVLRGGCCFNGGGDLRAARRYCDDPTKRYGGYGFRVALPASPALKTE